MLDLGEQPSSELFPAAGAPGPDPLLPLRMWLCAGCGLAQLVGACAVGCGTRLLGQVSGGAGHEAGVVVEVLALRVDAVDLERDVLHEHPRPPPDAQVVDDDVSGRHGQMPSSA